MNESALFLFWGIPVLFQLAAGFMTLGLARERGRRFLWGSLSLAFFLMALTSGRHMVRVLEGSTVLSDPEHAIPVFMISSFFLIAMTRLVPHVESISSSERELRRSEFRYRNMLDSASEGIWLLDNRTRTIYVNRRMAGLLGMTPSEMLGETIFHFMGPQARIEAEKNFKMNRIGMGEKIDLCLRRKDGSEIWTIFSSNLLEDEDGKFMGLLGVITDITGRKSAEKEMLRKSQHDLLTGLPNRILLADRLEQAIARSQRSGAGIAVVFIDLDKFKPINDAFGHEAGDSVLREVAHRLSGRLRHVDTLARYGGDEFVIILQDLDDDREAVVLAETFLEILRHPIIVAGKECAVGASIGISLYPKDGSSSEELIRRADVAMYAAKEEGGGKCLLFAGMLPRQTEEMPELV